MWPYWLLFSLAALSVLNHVQSSAVTYSHTPGPKKQSLGFGWLLIISVAVGLREEVGGDWETYLVLLQDATDQELWEAVSHGDPAYYFLNWVAANYGGGIYLVNTISAALFAWGLIVFCNKQPQPSLALLVSVPYLIIVVSMGYTRQSVAIGMVMLGFVALFKERVFRYFAWIIAASLFHKSAIVLTPLAILAIKRNRLFVLLGTFLVGMTLYVLLLQDAVDGLKRNYIDAEYQSSGAMLRVAMSALPATIFLIWRKRFYMPLIEERFWFWMSLTALILVVALLLSPSSTAVDRAALYWIPLQLMVWSYLPHVLCCSRKGKIVCTYLVIAFCAVVLLVWLFYSDHSILWVPYKSYAWEAFWQ